MIRHILLTGIDRTDEHQGVMAVCVLIAIVIALHVVEVLS